MAGVSNFEFFVMLPEMFEDALRLRLPTKFAPVLGAPRNLKLLLAGGEMMPTWDVQVIVDKGDIYLRDGWKRFAHAHDLRSGYMLVFRYDVARGYLIVTVFDHTTSRKEYTHAGAVGAVRYSLPVTPPSCFNEVLKKKSQLKCLEVPEDFHNAHGFAHRMEVEMQMVGRSWKVKLRRKEMSDNGYRRSAFGSGWHQFVVDNALGIGDACCFRVIRESSDSGDEDETDPDDEDDKHVLKVDVRKTDGTFVS